MSDQVPNAAGGSAPEPGPAPATQPAAAVPAAETVAPAAFSPEPAAVAAPEPVAPAGADAPPASETPAAVVEPAAEQPTTEAAPSILSDARPEGEKPAEIEAKPPEPPAEKPALPTYESFVVPEGVTLEPDKVGNFTGLLGEFEQRVASNPAEAHLAAQEFGQKLVDLHITEMRAAADRFTRTQTEVWQRTNEQWQADFRADPELGGNRQQTTLARMGGLMDMYGQQVGPDRLNAVRDVFTTTGAGNHPEVLRFVNWAASRLTERSRVVVPMTGRMPVTTTKAQRLYKNTPGAA